MKKRNTSRIFIVAILGIVLFEVLRTYLVMPMPGSQIKSTVGLAWVLHHYRLYFRLFFYALLLTGFLRSLHAKWFLTTSLLLITAGISTWVNYSMRADHIFQLMKSKTFAGKSANKVPLEKLVIGVEINGESKAYPIQYVGYHHRIFDTLSGKSIMITYCTVCRTGRVYEPMVDGHAEKFKLVGMDHFNAMFEDHSTGSWWRQATGEAITGDLKGKKLPEVPFSQVTLADWLDMHPASSILQPDSKFEKQYAKLENYDNGNQKSHLTRSDKGKWKDKSWIIGIQGKNRAYTYDWASIEDKVITDSLDGENFILWLSTDKKNYFTFILPKEISIDTKAKRLPGKSALVLPAMEISNAGMLKKFNIINGDTTVSMVQLKRLQSYQEFWHSWRTFHPGALQRN